MTPPLLQCNVRIFRQLSCSQQVPIRSWAFRSSQLRHFGSTLPVTNSISSQADPEAQKARKDARDAQMAALGNLIKIPSHLPMHPVHLRDCCPCPRCVDPSTRQKNFQTTDIPETVEPTQIETQPNGDVRITWRNDVPGFEEDHVSTFPSKVLNALKYPTDHASHKHKHRHRMPWSKDDIAKKFQFFNYQSYMTEDETLFRAMLALQKYGLLLVRNVPESETAVEAIASRIGNLRDSLYGRTWDVKSVPEAKNVAYTSKYLGLHMDLLYMADPPGVQLLHCLKNTCEGGLSLFSDALYAAKDLAPDHLACLANMKIHYHYKNAGEHYQKSHTVIEKRGHSNRNIRYINWSPPFQNSFPRPRDAKSTVRFSTFLEACRAFADLVEAPSNVFEYRLQEGECVIFNNRRILHGRGKFDTTSGERWLKGAYVDSDVFLSRLRVLIDKFPEMDDVAIKKAALYVNES